MIKKRGRPKGSVSETRRSVLIQVKVSEDEKQAYEEAARSEGLPMSAWIRHKLNRVVRGEGDE